MSDQTVHGVTADGGFLVRYDRAGKWYVEYPGLRMIPARRVTLREAVALATADGAEAVLGLPGGGAFDRKVTERTNAPQHQRLSEEGE